MACVLEDTYINFVNSGSKVRPISLTSRQNESQDDWFRAKFAKEAVQYINGSVMDREPVEWYIAGEPVWRGFVNHDGIELGRTDGFVTLQDSLKILEAGAIDKEFLEATIEEVVNYIWDQVVDTQGVLSGPEFTDPSGEVVLQHDTYVGGGEPGSQGMTNWLRENTPLPGGDGRMDFRGETPREALAEVCRIWNTTMFTRPDGTFVVGPPDMEPNAYGAGTHSNTWKITDFSIPQSKKPIGTIYVKGATPSLWKGPLEEAPTRYFRRLNNVTPWAAATIGSYEQHGTTIEYNKSSDPKALEDVAKRYLIQQYRSSQTGSVTVDIFGSPGGPETVAGLKVGDLLSVEQDSECGVPGGGFRINGIQHDWGPNKGWLIHFDVVGLVPSNIQSKSWWYDPLDPEMNSYDPSDYLKRIAPYIPVVALMATGISGLIFTTTAVVAAGTDYNMLPPSEQKLIDAAIDTADSVVDDASDTVNEYIDI